ncbi:MAG: RluA family pseudouridine synthase [Flavobacteriaceae bacterium]
MSVKKDCFTYFNKSITHVSLPDKFTFPFFYQPHPLCKLAAKELQAHLNTQTEWIHDFGLNANNKKDAIGKMFGVLVVQNQQNEIGYLSAFSGKLAESNHHSKFVPPVFDILTKNGFFIKGMDELNLLSSKLKTLEKDENYIALKALFKTKSLFATCEIEEFRELMRYAKKKRKEHRTIAKKNLSEQDYKIVGDDLIRESLAYKYQLATVTKSCNERLRDIQEKLEVLQTEIDTVQIKRKNKSAALQQKIFEHYQFLNTDGKRKDLTEIFTNTPIIAGAGECAAPKLLQYAFENQLKPIAIAEFWWGIPPKSQVRKHGNYYPACRGKCEPILGHMLKGIEMDENPLLINPAEGKLLEIVFEDEYLAVINKPSEFLSVPGKTIQDSVATRMKLHFPNATGPLIVHRLDMSTSGLMLIAKSLKIHKNLQSQFIKRTINKRYIALLDGMLTEDNGFIDLPLRTDLNDRPRQLVCDEHGKNARTRFKVIERKNEKTKVYFYPITGRTHQLRVHAAHSLGLNSPIVGDDLYGTKSNRLHLHAEFLEFTHPISKKRIKVRVDVKF